VRRGEIWWAELPEPFGRRPVVLLTRDAAYDFRASFTFAAITSRIRRIPSEVRVGRDEGLRQASVINLDDINTTNKERFVSKIGSLSEEKMALVEIAMRFSLGFALR